MLLIKSRVSRIKIRISQIGPFYHERIMIKIYPEMSVIKIYKDAFMIIFTGSHTQEKLDSNNVIFPYEMQEEYMMRVCDAKHDKLSLSKWHPNFYSAAGAPWKISEVPLDVRGARAKAVTCPSSYFNDTTLRERQQPNCQSCEKEG